MVRSWRRPRTDRLGEVVVGAAIEAGNDVLLGTERRQNHHRRNGHLLLADQPGCLESIHQRIGPSAQVRARLLEDLQRLTSSVTRGHARAELARKTLHHVAIGGGVIRHQHLRPELVSFRTCFNPAVKPPMAGKDPLGSRLGLARTRDRSPDQIFEFGEGELPRHPDPHRWSANARSGASSKFRAIETG